MGVDVGQPHLDFGDAMRIRRMFGLGEQARAFRISGKHPVEQTVVSARRLLRHCANLGPTRHVSLPRFRGKITHDQLEQSRFASIWTTRNNRRNTIFYSISELKRLLVAKDAELTARTTELSTASAELAAAKQRKLDPHTRSIARRAL